MAIWKQPIMKAKRLCVCLAVAATVAASAADLRYVNDTAVDLSPLDAWLKQRKGERPLKHWKELRVGSISAPPPIPKCSVTIEGETKTVFLRNLPPPTLDAFAQVALLEPQVQKLSDSVAAERIRVDKLKADAQAHGHPRRVKHALSQQAKVASTDLSASTKQLDALRAKLKSAKEREQKLARELAMNTGQKYAGLEVWDCGRR